MFTKQQYINNQVSTNQYFNQFIQNDVIKLVKLYLGLDSILNSKNDDFSDIPKSKLEIVALLIIRLKPIKSNLKLAHDIDSISNGIHIAKAASLEIKYNVQ